MGPWSKGMHLKIAKREEKEGKPFCCCLWALLVQTEHESQMRTGSRILHTKKFQEPSLTKD